MKKRIFGFLKPKIEFGDWGGTVQTLLPPDEVTLPLSRPGQMPFDPIVKVGDNVKTGQLIAMLPSRTGVHASITGLVTTIGPGDFWSGEKVLTITIRRESDDKFEAPKPVKEFQSVSRDQLIKSMADLGFASPWKPEELKDYLSGIERVSVKTVIIKAVDNEPSVSVQRRFLTEFVDDFVESVKAVKKIAGQTRVVVAIPDSMQGKARSLLTNDIDIFPLKNSLLETNSRLLVKKITGKFFTPNDNLRQHGIAVISAENVAFVGWCLHKGQSRINKLVTVAAPGITQPTTVRVRIGTPVGHILNCLNIRVKSNDRVIFGGTLSGVAQPDLSACVTLGVNGINVLDGENITHLTDALCINCGRCVSVCPVKIQVNLVGRYAEFGFFDKAVMGGAGSCVECGLCAYVCPSHRPLLQYMRFANHEYRSQLERQQVAEEGEE